MRKGNELQPTPPSLIYGWKVHPTRYRTWKEFKDGMESQGLTDDDQIRCIDIDFADSDTIIVNRLAGAVEIRDYWVAE